MSTEDILNEPEVVDFVHGVKLMQKLGGYIKRRGTKEWGVTVQDGKVLDINFKTGRVTSGYLRASNVLKKDWEYVKP